MNHVFISYRAEGDAHIAVVRARAERLRASGLPVMLDQFYLAQHLGIDPDRASLGGVEFSKRSQ